MKVKASQNKAENVEGRKIKLSIAERMGMGELIPRESNILTLILAKDIMEKTKITQPEKEKINLRQEGNAIKWDKKCKEKAFSFTNAELELLKEQISTLDKQNKVKPELLSLCLKIRKE